MTTASPLNVFGTLCFLCATFLHPDIDQPKLELAATFTYTTLQRSVTSSNGLPQAGISYNAADETPHGALVEVAWLKPAPAGQGTGTPAFELRAGIMEANSHTESLITREGEAAYASGTGNGRFEPIGIFLRYPLGPHGSLEGSFERPYYRGSSLVVTGFPLYANPSVRDFLADTRAGSLGYRLRGDGWEAAAAFLYARHSIHESTAGSYDIGTGNVFGGQLEATRRFGSLDLALRGAIQKGTSGIIEAFQPEFDVMRYDSPFSREYAGVRARYRFGRASLIGWVDGIHTQAPFWDALAPGNEETTLHDSGLRHTFHTTEVLVGLAGELTFGPNIAVRALAGRREGNESVSFAATAVNPNAVTLHVRRSGWTAGLGFRVLAVP